MANKKDRKDKQQEEVQNRWTRLNDWAQEHAKLLIALCGVLVVLIVFLIAYPIWVNVRYDRGVAEIEDARDVGALEELKKKYADVADLHAMVLYRIGNRYYEDGKLDKAREAYEEFRKWYADKHYLWQNVHRALNALQRDQDFLEERREGMSKEFTLYAHPKLRESGTSDMPRFGPVPQPNPRLSIALPQGLVVLELFEDEAPNTVANFIDLANKKYFDGLAFTRVGEDRLQVTEKTANPEKHTLAFEKTSREVERGMLIMVRTAEGTNQGAVFQIATKNISGLMDNVTVFGMVDTGMEFLEKVTDKDAIKSVMIDRKRDHEYKPVVIPPK